MFHGGICQLLGLNILLIRYLTNNLRTRESNVSHGMCQGL